MKDIKMNIKVFLALILATIIPATASADSSNITNYFNISGLYLNTKTTYNGAWDSVTPITLPKEFVYWTCERSPVGQMDGQYAVTVSCTQKNGTSISSTVSCSGSTEDLDAARFTIKSNKKGKSFTFTLFCAAKEVERSSPSSSKETS